MPTYKTGLIIEAFDADLGPDVRPHVAFDDRLGGLEEDAHGKKEGPLQLRSPSFWTLVCCAPTFLDDSVTIHCIIWNPW